MVHRVLIHNTPHVPFQGTVGWLTHTSNGQPARTGAGWHGLGGWARARGARARARRHTPGGESPKNVESAPRVARFCARLRQRKGSAAPRPASALSPRRGRPGRWRAGDEKPIIRTDSTEKVTDTIINRVEETTRTADHWTSEAAADTATTLSQRLSSLIDHLAIPYCRRASAVAKSRARMVKCMQWRVMSHQSKRL
jgi:hypothetical protein